MPLSADQPGSSPRRRGAVRRRLTRLTIAVVVGGALLAPAVRDQDSFPLATYPMYSSSRDREVSLPTAVGLDERNRRRRLSPEVIGASPDPLIVVGELRDAIAGDRIDELCTAIAGRVDDPELIAVEVVTEDHDAVDQVRGRSSLRSRTVHERCPVPP